ncbi:P2 [Chiqui virus]|uniref:P2 n=1 Tax=Chiqui virus TaxID=2250219 RepID=UPI000DC7B7E2|nr:P2 [Chiqui virus]AWX66222.1 P2 [Chiqui virus]
MPQKNMQKLKEQNTTTTALKPTTQPQIEERDAIVQNVQQSPQLQTERSALEQVPKTLTIEDKSVIKVDKITAPNDNETPEKAKNVESIDTQSTNINKVIKDATPQTEPPTVAFEAPNLTSKVDNSNVLKSTTLSLINQLPPVPVEPADLTKMITEPQLPKVSDVQTIIHRENIFEIKPSSIYMKTLPRARPFITTAMTVNTQFEAGQGQRLAPMIDMYEAVFKQSAHKFVPENTNIMSILPAWNEEIFKPYGIYTITGNVVSESMYTKWYAPANPRANTHLEEATGRALMMLVMMYEPKPIMIDNSSQLMSISYLNTGFEHLQVLSGRTILKPPTESIALAIPSMRNGIVAQQLSDRISQTEWRLGRIAAVTDDNGVDIQLDIADDIDQFTAYAYNEVGKRMYDSTMTAGEFKSLLDTVIIPGTTVQLLDTTDRTKYHHDFIENPRAGELTLAACCMHPEFARSLRPRLLQYLRSSGAIIENLKGSPDDGTSMEPGYLEFMTKFREATQSACVDAFYSSQIPKVTLPTIRHHNLDAKHIYGIIPVYAAVQYTRIFPHQAFYARDEIARIIFHFGVSFFPEETRNFLDKYGRYDAIPGDNTAFSTKHGYAGHVPSIFIPFKETISYYSEIADLLRYTKTSFTQPYDQAHCPRFNSTNVCWPAYYQKASDLDDSRTPMDIGVVVSVFEKIIAKINKMRKLQGSVINTVITYIKTNADELMQFVPAMETELAQLERTVTTLPLTLGTHFQGSMSEPLEPILAIETTHPDYQKQEMYMEQIDPEWVIDISVILVCGYGVTMRFGEVANSTASASVKLEQRLTFPNPVHEYFSQLGIISGLSLQMQPYGVLNAIWSKNQVNPDIISLRPVKKVRNADIDGILSKFAEVHQKALAVGQAPLEFQFKGTVVTKPTNTIETDPMVAFNTLRAAAVDGEGNLHSRKTLLIDPKFALYARNRLRLEDKDQKGQWAGKAIRLLSDWDMRRIGVYAGFVRANTFMSRKRRGLLIIRQPVEQWDPTTVLSPYELQTTQKRPFKVVELLPQNIGSKVHNGNYIRAKITVTLDDGTNVDLMDDVDFNGYIFQIRNPSLLADEDRTWLVNLVQSVEFGIFLSEIDYTSFNLETTHRGGMTEQVSIHELLRYQEKAVSNIIFADSRHNLMTLYEKPMGQMFRYVYPTANDGVRLLAKDWYQITDKLGANFQMPDVLYFQTGDLTPDLRPRYTDGTMKISVDSLCSSNQIRVFLPASQINKSFIIRMIMPSSIIPA